MKYLLQSYLVRVVSLQIEVFIENLRFKTNYYIKVFFFSVSCTIWTRRDIKKAELSVLDISSAIIARVESMPESMTYFYSGLMLSIVMSIVPSIRRISDYIGMEGVGNNSFILDVTNFDFQAFTEILSKFLYIAFGSTFWYALKKCALHLQYFL